MLSILQSILHAIMNRTRIGGFTKIIPIQPVVQITPDYSDGDAIGEVYEIEVGRLEGYNSGIIKSVEVINNAAASAISIYFFTDEITAITDNGAFAPTIADMKNLVPGAPISLTSFSTISSTINYGSNTEILIPYSMLGTKLYMVLVANTTINFAAIDDLHVKVGILQD